MNQQQQYFDLDQGKNIPYVNDCCSTSGYSSNNSPTSMTLSPSHSPETLNLQNEFAQLNLPALSNSPSPRLQQLGGSPYHQNQMMANGNLCMEIDGNAASIGSILNGNATFGNINSMQHMPVDQFYATQPPQTIGGFHQIDAGGIKNEYCAQLHIAEQPVEKFRFRYKSEMHGTHGSLNGINSKRTPKTFPEVILRNYSGPAVIRCSLFQTNLDSPHSHQLVVRKDERDVCDPHDLHVSQERGYVAQFINMGIIHTAKKYIFDELFKKKQDRLVFQMGRRELSTKQLQELHQETEREAKDMNLNQVRLCFEAFKIENNQKWTPIAPPVFSNPINNRKSAQTGELRITRLSKPTGSVMGNDELILLVEKVSKKNIKVRFFEENDDGETVWEAYAKFRESDVHHQYAIVCQTPAYKDKDVEREVAVSIELIRPSDDERSFPPLPFRYKPRDAIISRKRRRTCSTLTSSTSSSSGSLHNSMDLPKTVPQMGAANVSLHDQTISQEFGREFTVDQLLNSESFRKMLEPNSSELEKLCVPDIGCLEHDGLGYEQTQSNYVGITHYRSLSSTYLTEIFKIYDANRRAGKISAEDFANSCSKVQNLFTTHALKNVNNDTLLHEVISQRTDNLKLAIKTFKVIEYFKLQELAHSVLNLDGDSGLHVACQHDRPNYIRPLLSLGCNPNQQNHIGNTALHVAVKEKHTNCIDFFFNAPNGVRLDLSLKNDDGLTPLHMAIRQNSSDVAKKLINYDRSSINVSNTTDGNNALHMAVLEQNVELLVLILDAQNLTDILMAKNSAGYTPLELARAKDNESCVLLLQKVYPDKGESAMTWIPLNVKEEMDSSSAEDDDESNLDVPTSSMSSSSLSTVKTEEIDMDFKTEQEDEDHAKQADAAIDPKIKLEQLLSNKNKFDQLVKQLNEPSSHNPALSKWKELAEKALLSQLVFLWSSSEGMLKYIHHKSSDQECRSFARALQELGMLNA
ncbi:nuclear factor NF-kappa-B p110 subunit [Drosophila grimshawi]|uniref:GH18237 n=1 Tax=Drosophila grimshawi TaxID=7222 RepID=B4JFM1_DROGR|nr:nuclear factor NF-kappa-B p110 subunit [Drosophila grimshawi]EDV93502.1 GH18237 [Drosophila grimshawi]